MMKDERALGGAFGLAAAIIALGGCSQGSGGGATVGSSASGGGSAVPTAGTSAGFPGLSLLPGQRPTLGDTVTATASPPPISGGTLLALTNGTTAVASDPDRDALYVVNVEAAKVSFTVALQAGDEPGRLVEDGAGRVHVALRSGGALVTIDPADGTITARRNACPAPRGLAWDSAADLIWVACATGELVAFPAAGGAATQQFVVERGLRDIVIGASGDLAVSKFREAEVLHLATGGTIAWRAGLDTPSPGTFAARVAWRTVAAPGGNLLIVNQAHSTLSVSTMTPGGYGAGLGVSFVSPGSTGVTGTFDGGFPFVEPPSPPDVPSDGGADIVQSASGAIASEISVVAPDGTRLLETMFDGVLPVDVALSPDGTQAVVAAAGDGLVSLLPDIVVIPVAGAFSSASPAVPVDGGGPPDASGPSDGSVESAADGTGGVAPLVSTKLPVAGNATTQAIAVAFDRSGELLVQTREPATLWVLDASRSAWKAITLSTTSRKDTGHDVFHSVAGALIACASCHPEGGDDSHVWLLDGQTRRTPSLRGTIAGTAPYHWLGDEPTLNVLANDVYTGRMNGVSLDTSQLAALESWVEAIPAPPAPTWVDSAAAKRGQTIFVSETAACSKCHSGPKFTNNATTDVGTGGAFQVPPLVGVGWRTPLLHIGCGTTVADRFGGCATTGHGNTAGLSASQLSDLTAYLDSL